MFSGISGFCESDLSSIDLDSSFLQYAWLDFLFYGILRYDSNHCNGFPTGPFCKPDHWLDPLLLGSTRDQYEKHNQQR